MQLPLKAGTVEFAHPKDQYFGPLETGGCFKQVVLYRINATIVTTIERWLPYCGQVQQYTCL